ncbi:MAG: TIGR00730 family Rossman fold protein, partial [Odoribacter sp.]|nr:TIGR00730 family Rossman fold protein [Odoribacter sp.]
MKIAVFCASANVAPVYMEAAEKLGEYIGKSGWELVYGGTNMGLMDKVARSTMAHGGKVTGIIPACISERGVAAEGVDCLIETVDMKERKALLREHADAFVALPGGWGTLEEISEVITLKQLGEHNKPVVFLN